MPRKQRTQYNAQCTPQEYAASKEAATLEGVPLAEFIRRAVKQRCESQGFEYPDNLVRRGKYQRDNENTS